MVYLNAELHIPDRFVSFKNFENGFFQTVTKLSAEPVRGGEGDTGACFGWVCAAQVFKFGPRFSKNIAYKMKSRYKIANF